MGDFCQNIRQDFDIYRNIDNQKAKKLKKKQRKKNKTHKQTSEQTNKQTNKQRNKTNKQAVSPVFFWSDAMVGAIACGQTKQTKRKQASNHANQHKLMDFTCRNRPAPHISKSLPLGFRKWLLGLADLSEGVCFLIEIVKRQNYRRFGNFKQQCVYGNSGWVGRPYMFMTLGS